MWNDGLGHHPLMGWSDNAWPWLTMGLHSAFWLLVLGLGIFAVVLLLRRRERTATVSGTTAALAILESRYARGEIDRGEYLERKGDLS